MSKILLLHLKKYSLRKFLVLVFSTCSIIGCSHTKKLMKDAQVLEKGGLNSEAFEKYSSIYSNYSDAEARVGMKRTAQQILNVKMQNAQMLCMKENYEEALDSYDASQSFLDSYSLLELTTSGNIAESRMDCRDKYIDMLYARAESFVKNDDFENAQVNIKKIFSLDRKNQKAQFLETMCDLLPNYSAGIAAIEKGLYRDAYIYLNEVCKIDAGFRDALHLRDDAMENAAFSVVYKIVDNRNVSDGRETALAAKIKGELLSGDNPFLELLERDDLDVIFQEQQETLSPEFEGATGAEAGKLRRARFILSGELISLDYQSTPETKSKCDCYAAYRIYSEYVNCYQFSRSASCIASFKYKLLDAETGKLYKSDVISFSDEDTGKNFKYEIMKKLSLTSPTGMKDREVNLSNLQNPEVDLLLTEQEMLNKMNKFIAVKLANEMNSFRP